MRRIGPNKCLSATIIRGDFRLASHLAERITCNEKTRLFKIKSAKNRHVVNWFRKIILDTKAWEVTTQRHDEIEAEGRGVVLPASPLAGIELTAMSDTIRALVEGFIRPAGADAVVRALAALRLAMELNVHGAALPAALSYEA